MQESLRIPPGADAADAADVDAVCALRKDGLGRVAALCSY